MLAKQMIEEIVQQGIDATDAEAGSVWLLQRSRVIISPIAALGPKASGITGFSLKPDEGIVGQVISHNQEILLEEAIEDPAWAFYFDSFSGFRTRSVLCIPLMREGTSIGALQLLNKRGGGFAFADLVVARALAREVVAVIEAAGPIDE